MSDVKSVLSNEREKNTTAIVNANALNDDQHKNPGGAAVEEVSPLGQQFGAFSAICLNLSQMIGTGIFSTPGSVLRSTGSVGLSLLYWVIGLFIAWAGLAYYLELGSYFPNRAGAEVVFLEQAYKRPRYFFPATYAASTVITSFSASSAIVFANYVFAAARKKDYSEWEQKAVAIGGYTLVCLIVFLSTKWSIRLSNALAVIKALLLIFVSITGLVVLGGHTRIQNPTANFKTGFDGTVSNANSLVVGLTKIVFSYNGWFSAHQVLNEVRGGTKTLRWTSPLSLGLVFILYFLANIAYFAAVPLEEIRTGGTLVAALFFNKVFGEYAGTRVLPVFVALSALGNLLAVLIAHARIIREVGRQGVLPWSSFWTSTWPIGTPGGPILLKYTFTLLVIVALPFGDAFNFVVDLQSYPNAIFTFLSVIGVWIIRRHRQSLGLGRGTYQAWNVALIFSLVISLFLLVVPWVPPAGGAYAGNVSFWYATYCVVGIGIIATCSLYWFFWFRILPKAKGFIWIEEIDILQNGEVSKHFTRRYPDSVVGAHAAQNKDGKENGYEGLLNETVVVNGLRKR